MGILKTRCAALAAFAIFSSVAAAAPPASDLLSVSIDTGDAERFALMMKSGAPLPDAVTLQARYLNGAGRGVEIFTPYRIENAANLAAAIAANPKRYRYAIDMCLPIVKRMDGELRAIYLAYRGLLPDRTLPAIHIVFGANNSGGTAQPDAQVIGLEAMCSPGTSPEQFRDSMRAIFAHETVHTWQSAPSARALKDGLLLAALREGTPDYLARIVTGREPSTARANFGEAQVEALWRDFQQDRAAIAAINFDDLGKHPALSKRFYRWFQNAGNVEAGRPSELGYWVGMQIAAAYVEKAYDKRAAIEALIVADDPAAILASSGYGTQFRK